MTNISSKNLTLNQKLQNLYKYYINAEKWKKKYIYIFLKLFVLRAAFVILATFRHPDEVYLVAYIFVDLQYQSY